MPHIAILVPVCSRGHSYNALLDTPLFTKLYPSFQETKEDAHTYTFFIGFDDDDIFYTEHVDELMTVSKEVHVLHGCQHAPAKAWNQLAGIAYTSPQRFDYFFQVGDDITLLTPNWTSRFIDKLSTHSNLGVVGPCYTANYYGRIRNGSLPVIENSFVHRTHLDIFRYFFHPEIMNWFCDDWITRIYVPFFSEIQVDMECINTILGSRYQIIKCPMIDTYVEEGIQHILTHQNAKA